MENTPDHITAEGRWIVELEIHSLDQGVPDGLHLDELTTIMYDVSTSPMMVFTGSWWDINWLLVWYFDGDIKSAHEQLMYVQEVTDAN